MSRLILSVMIGVFLSLSLACPDRPTATPTSSYSPTATPTPCYSPTATPTPAAECFGSGEYPRGGSWDVAPVGATWVVEDGVATTTWDLRVVVSSVDGGGWGGKFEVRSWAEKAEYDDGAPPTCTISGAATGEPTDVPGECPGSTVAHQFFPAELPTIQPGCPDSAELEDYLYALGGHTQCYRPCGGEMISQAVMTNIGEPGAFFWTHNALKR